MTMDKVTFIEVETLGGVETHVIIDRGNGDFTSMLKSTYEAQQAQQSSLPSNSADPVEKPKK
jgi:hypothetical protein